MRHPFGRSVAPSACLPASGDGTVPRCASDPTMALTLAANVKRMITPRREDCLTRLVIAAGLYGTDVMAGRPSYRRLNTIREQPIVPPDTWGVLFAPANERASESTRTERAGEAARERACRGVRGAKPLGVNYEPRGDRSAVRPSRGGVART